MPAMPRSNVAIINTINGGPPIANEVDANASTYAAQRAGLIAFEKGKRFDAERREQRTSVEIRADDILKALRKDDLDAIQCRADDLAIQKGASWQLSKSRNANERKLYKLLEQMPKGGVLHCHFDATVDAGWLIEQSYNEEQLHIRAESPLITHKAMYETPITFRLLPMQAGTQEDGGFARSQSADIYSAAYQANTWIPLSQARKMFPFPNIFKEPIPGYEKDVLQFSQADGKRSEAELAFDAYLFSRMTLTPLPTTLSPPITTSRQAWQRFIQTFVTTEGLQTNQTRYAYFIRSFQLAIADNISYIEPRVNFFIPTFVGHDGQANVTHADLVALFETALKAVQAELPSGKTFDAKIIYSTVRIVDAKQIQWYIDDAIALKEQFPHLIVGFDLVGHEDQGVTLLEYAPQLLAMREKCNARGVDLPFCFHAGETLGDGDAYDDNLYDAILLGSKRIGHAFSLVKHPVLMETIRDRQICVESCPISSHALRYTDSLSSHPVLTMLANGCHVVISNDDCCQFLNMGLTPDFYSILMASDHLDLTSLYILVKNSLQFSLHPDAEEKRALLANLDAEWKYFIEHIVPTFEA